MNRTRKTTIILAIATLMGLSGKLAQAEDDAAKINSANQALVDGKLDEALAQYDSVAQTMPASPLLAYNRGVALYRQGKMDQARLAFATASDTDEPELAAKAAFNLGNCHYAAAVQQSETDRPVAIESLRTAIAHYRSALQSNPADTDSRANIELAQQLINKLQAEEQQQQQDQQKQDQQQQDQQQQDQQQDNQNSQNQDSEQSDQQESESSDSQEGKSGKENSDESKSDEKPSDQSSSEQDNSQQEKSDESKSDESKSDESNTGKSHSDNQDEPEKQSAENPTGSNSDEPKQDQTDPQAGAGSDNQQPEPSPEQQSTGQPSEQPQSGEPKDDRQPQPQPGEQQQDEPSETQPGQQAPAGSTAPQAQPGDAAQTPGYAVSQPGELGENMDKEEAMKMLQAIRDRDLMRRMQKLNETRRQHRSVDRDW